MKIDFEGGSAMLEYSVGQVVQGFKNHAECTQFDILDSGAVMLVFFKNPKKREIEQFGSGKMFEIRFIELGGIIMITAKIGSLHWMEAPYSIHLSRNLTNLPRPDAGQGLGLTVHLVDATTGEIKCMRLIGLSETFTKALSDAAERQLARPFSLSEHNRSVRQIWDTYVTSQIANMSKNCFRINH